MARWMDIDQFGKEHSNGTPYEYFDEEALKNALMLWLGSRKGEFLMFPDRGGPLDRTIFKNMSAGNMNKLRFALRNALDKFTPAIEIKALSIEPDYNNRLWEIGINYINPLTNRLQSLTIYTKDTSHQKDYTYEEINYEDDNLLNFVQIKKPSMNNRLLIYDSVQGYWRWGKFLFTNFSMESSNFDAILSYINTGTRV